MPKIERRYFQSSMELEQRADGKTPLIRGHAAVFNKLSVEMFGFRERIKAGAFAKSLAGKPDVRALFNHDPSAILGRTKADTLRLVEDDAGLRYEIDPPETTIARDLIESLKRGDIDQSSFGFRVITDEWHKENGKAVRELIEVDINDGDVSPVTYPAYPQTAAEARSVMWPEGMPEEIRKQLEEPMQVEISRLNTVLTATEQKLATAEALLQQRDAEIVLVRAEVLSAKNELASLQANTLDRDKRYRQALSEAEDAVRLANSLISGLKLDAYRRIIVSEK